MTDCAASSNYSCLCMFHAKSASTAPTSIGCGIVEITTDLIHDFLELERADEKCDIVASTDGTIIMQSATLRFELGSAFLSVEDVDLEETIVSPLSYGVKKLCLIQAVRRGQDIAQRFTHC